MAPRDPVPGGPFDEGEHSYWNRLHRMVDAEVQAEMDCKALLTDKKLFCTEAGLFSVGPPDMAIGDELAVAFGARTPYILRQCGDVTDLMGEAYVDGLMNGGIDMLHEQYPEDYPAVDLVTAPLLRRPRDDAK